MYFFLASTFRSRMPYLIQSCQSRFNNCQTMDVLMQGRGAGVESTDYHSRVLEKQCSSLKRSGGSVGAFRAVTPPRRGSCARFLSIPRGICKNLLLSNRVHLGVRNQMRVHIIRDLLGHRVFIEIVRENASFGQVRRSIAHYGVDSWRGIFRLFFC